MKRWVEAIEDWASGLLIAGGLLVLFYGVILRYILHVPTTWQDGVAHYLVIWGAFIGASVALRDNHHIRVELLYSLFPKKVQRFVNIFANLVTLAFFVFILIYGYNLVSIRFLTGQQSLEGFPLWLIYLILPLAGIILSIRTLDRLYRLFTGKPESDHEEQDVML